MPSDEGLRERLLERVAAYEAMLRLDGHREPLGWTRTRDLLQEAADALLAARRAPGAWICPECRMDTDRESCCGDDPPSQPLAARPAAGERGAAQGNGLGNPGRTEGPAMPVAPVPAPAAGERDRLAAEVERLREALEKCVGLLEYLEPSVRGGYSPDGALASARRALASPPERERRLAAEVARLMDGREIAWGVIANVSGGRWDRQSPEWREAAHRWCDEHWHPALDRNGYSPRPEPPRGEERDG
jgi:hypothetical protein